MSDTLKKVIPIYLFLIIYILMNVFMSFISLKDNYVLFISPLIMFLLFILTFISTRKFKLRNRDKYSKSKSIIKVIIVCFIIYYLSGLVFGFKDNIYISNIINNFISIFLVINLKEYIRYRLIAFSKSKINLFLLSSLFILFDISFFGISKYIFIIIISNIISTFLIYKVSSLTNYIYIILLLISNLFVFLVPTYNILITSIFLFLLLIILYLSIDTLVKYEDKDNNRRKKSNIVSNYSFYVLGFIFIFFMLGLFKYQPVAILSDSMKTYYSRGDAVIIEKIGKEDVSFIEKNDIIYYRYDNKYITHRVYDIKLINNNYVFYTKGDNNQYIDNWTISEDDIIGVVKFRIKYIGWPAVWLYDLVA